MFIQIPLVNGGICSLTHPQHVYILFFYFTEFLSSPQRWVLRLGKLLEYGTAAFHEPITPLSPKASLAHTTQVVLDRERPLG